jgi:hypothetical protein
MGKQGFRDTETDVYISQEISGGDSWVFGIDNTANDSWKLSNGSVLGTNDTFIMRTDGNRTLPLQSCFLAIVPSTISNITGDGTTYGPIIFSSEIFDQSSDYDNTTGIFQAPISGRYALMCYVDLDNMVAGVNRDFTVDIVTTAYTYRIASFDGGNLANPADQDFGVSGSIIADMAASDTAYVQCRVAGGGKVVSVIDGHFSGGLLV